MNNVALGIAGGVAYLLYKSEAIQNVGTFVIVAIGALAIAVWTASTNKSS